jgi:hypothetical protein
MQKGRCSTVWKEVIILKSTVKPKKTTKEKAPEKKVKKVKKAKKASK